jgi:hypothetical protein
VAARPQARQTERGVAFQMLVAGLAADPELLAQIRDAKASALGQHDEPIDLFHGCLVLPGHRPRTVTYHPGQCVTYLPGSYPM